MKFCVQFSVSRFIMALTCVAGSSAAALDQDLTRLLETLVRTPSVNGESPERSVVELVAAFAADRACETKLIAVDPDRPVLTVRAGPADRAGLLIIAHTDTVSAEPTAAWTKPPFGAEIANGRLYGRGAIDCKGGLVAGLAAVMRANARKVRIPITLVCVPDEESGATGELGIKELARRGELRGLGAIYAYPGQDKIVLGHRGVYRFSIHVAGPGGHTGAKDWQNSDRANSALLGASELALALERYGIELGQTPGRGRFADHATVLTPAVIRAGTSPGQVPGSATLTVDVRLLPDVDLDRVKADVDARTRAIARRRPGLHFARVDETYIPPTEIDPNEAIVRVVARAARRELGISPRLVVSGPANESYLLNGYGIPTLILGPVGKNAHGPDEYVELDSIETTARVYARAHRMLERMR